MSNEIGFSRKLFNFMLGIYIVLLSIAIGLSGIISNASMLYYFAGVIIGTTVGDIIVEGNAGWKTRNNANDIARTIIEACHRAGDFYGISENAIRTIKANFSRNTITKLTGETYRSLIQGGFYE